MLDKLICSKPSFAYISCPCTYVCDRLLYYAVLSSYVGNSHTGFDLIMNVVSSILFVSRKDLFQVTQMVPI